MEERPTAGIRRKDAATGPTESRNGRWISLKVTIDRANCTSCGTCWETCPAFFEENPDDHFSQVIERFRLRDTIAEGSAPDELEACVSDAADLCPVQIIALEES